MALPLPKPSDSAGSDEPGQPGARDHQAAAVLAAIARSVNASLDLDPILQTVAEGARDLCGSDLAAIALREPDTGAMVFHHRAGQRDRQADRLIVEPGRGVGGLVLSTGRPCRSDDLPNDPRFAHDGAYLAAAAEERIVTVMAVPIHIGATLEGLLYVDNRRPRPFTDGDEIVLRQLADHAAIAIRNARLLARTEQARREAEAANRAKDEFLATLSHELRTPLNAVLGWAVTLRNHRLDAAAAARALEVIERNARALGQLIEDLLDISRIVTGKLRLDMRLVDLVAVVEAALDAVRPAADAKAIRLQAALDTRTGPISGDPDRLQQVVWNLLSNAIKFTPKGGQVEVSLQRLPWHAEVVVTDSGPGIAPELLPHIFDRFRQADSALARSQGGLGIGLALVRHIVELHGGTVRAESAGAGRGAIFIVQLPLLVRQEEATRALALRGVGLPEPVSLQGVRVLVVEDQSDSLRLFQEILSASGAEVQAVASAAEGLQTFVGWRPDVLVSDIEMPGEDGYSLIRKIRALPAERGGATPAVAVTAHGGVEDRIRLLSAGFQLHVPKPVEPAELIAVIANLAGRIDRPDRGT